jgi:spore coat protein U-like protein
MQQPTLRALQKKLSLKCYLAMLILLYGCLPTETVFAACSISATTAAFGNYSPFSATPLDTTGTITVRCTNPARVRYRITLSTGGSGSYATRKMAHSTVTLNYNLYTNAARSLIWGDGTGGTSYINVPAPGVRCNTSPYCRHTLYGRIPTGQTTSVTGSYTDTITATLTY